MKASHFDDDHVDSPEYRGRVERALSIRELLALHDDPNYEQLMHEYLTEKDKLGCLPGENPDGTERGADDTDQEEEDEAYERNDNDTDQGTEDRYQ